MSLQPMLYDRNGTRITKACLVATIVNKKLRTYFVTAVVDGKIYLENEKLKPRTASGVVVMQPRPTLLSRVFHWFKEMC